MSNISMRLPKNVAGIIDGLEWAMRFMEWANSLRKPPTPEQIKAEFGVSRATSYRYHAAWQAMNASGSIKKNGESA